MSTPVRSTFSSAAGVEQVFGVLTSQQWVATKAERFSDGSVLTQHEPRPDGGLLLAVSRELPAGGPGFLEKFLPRDGRILETFDWGAALGDGTRHGQWKADLP